VIGNSAFTTNRAGFMPEPRVGLAWDPFGRSRTVVHAGFGAYRALLLNRANFGIPNTVVYTAAGNTPSPTAGVITSTGHDVEAGSIRIEAVG